MLRKENIRLNEVHPILAFYPHFIEKNQVMEMLFFNPAIRALNGNQVRISS